MWYRFLGIQIAQCRQYLQTLGPNVGIICILGSLGDSVEVYDLDLYGKEVQISLLQPDDSTHAWCSYGNFPAAVEPVLLTLQASGFK